MQILACLQGGDKQMPEIYKGVLGKPTSIRAALGKLEKDGEIDKIAHGHYRLKAVQDTPAGGGKFARRGGKHRNN